MLIILQFLSCSVDLDSVDLDYVNLDSVDLDSVNNAAFRVIDVSLFLI